VPFLFSKHSIKSLKYFQRLLKKTLKVHPSEFIKASLFFVKKKSDVLFGVLLFLTS